MIPVFPCEKKKPAAPLGTEDFRVATQIAGDKARGHSKRCKGRALRLVAGRGESGTAAAAIEIPPSSTLYALEATSFFPFAGFSCNHYSAGARVLQVNISKNAPAHSSVLRSLLRSAGIAI